MTRTDAYSLLDERRSLLLHVRVQVASIVSIQGNDSHRLGVTTAITATDTDK